MLSRIEPLQSYHSDSKSHQLQADIESLPVVGIVLYSTIRNMAITNMQTIRADHCTPHTLGCCYHRADSGFVGTMITYL